MADTSQSGSSSGAFSTLGQKNVTYGVMGEQLVSQIKNQGGTDFIVIQRARQSDEPKIWSTGDQEQTQHLLRQVFSTFSTDRQPEPTS